MKKHHSTSPLPRTDTQPGLLVELLLGLLWLLKVALWACGLAVVAILVGVVGAMLFGGK